MFRMLLEVVMVVGLIGGLFWVNKAMAKESKENRARVAKTADDD